MDDLSRLVSAIQELKFEIWTYKALLKGRPEELRCDGQLAGYEDVLSLIKTIRNNPEDY